MKLAKEINKSVIESMADGYGFRLVIFLQGCNHHCKGCHNKETWDINNGFEYSISEIKEYLKIKYLEGYYNGITFSGGDPILQQEELFILIKQLKEEITPIKKINFTLYTGYLYENIKNMPVISEIDYLIDGKFELDKKSPFCKFRGSSNQRLLKLQDGEIISLE